MAFTKQDLNHVSHTLDKIHMLLKDTHVLEAIDSKDFRLFVELKQLLIENDIDNFYINTLDDVLFTFTDIQTMKQRLYDDILGIQNCLEEHSDELNNILNTSNNK